MTYIGQGKLFHSEYEAYHSGCRNPLQIDVRMYVMLDSADEVERAIKEIFERYRPYVFAINYTYRTIFWKEEDTNRIGGHTFFLTKEEKGTYRLYDKKMKMSRSKFWRMMG